MTGAPLRAVLESPVGPLEAVANREGALLSLGRAAPGTALSRHGAFTLLEAELARYWAGEAVSFTVPVAPVGTPFQQRVWAALRAIPWGRAISYAELAVRVGSNPRAVGQANGANPVGIIVPCHRVIGRDGSLVGYAGGIEMKRFLLKLERVILL